MKKVLIFVYNGICIYVSIIGRFVGLLVVIFNTFIVIILFVENNFVLNNFFFGFFSVINEVVKMINIFKIVLLFKNFLIKFIIFRK